MNNSDLLALTANGENTCVLFSRDDVRPEQIAKEVVALANFQGGRILLGVNDDGSIAGIQRTDIEDWVIDTIFGRIVHPMIPPIYEEIQVDERLRVAVITISQGTSKPYVVRHRSQEEFYVRTGSTSQLATREQRARLFALAGCLHPDLLPVSRSSLHDLCKARLEDFLTAIVGDHEIPTSDEAWSDRLCASGFYDRT